MGDSADWSHQSVGNVKKWTISLGSISPESLGSYGSQFDAGSCLAWEHSFALGEPDHFRVRRMFLGLIPCLLRIIRPSTLTSLLYRPLRGRTVLFCLRRQAPSRSTTTSSLAQCFLTVQCGVCRFRIRKLQGGSFLGEKEAYPSRVRGVDAMLRYVLWRDDERPLFAGFYSVDRVVWRLRVAGWQNMGKVASCGVTFGPYHLE